MSTQFTYVYLKVLDGEKRFAQRYACGDGTPCPFDRVSLLRVNPLEPYSLEREWEIIGAMDASSRAVIVSERVLQAQVDNHLEYAHGIVPGQSYSKQTFEHATARAAVALLMD